MLDRRGFLKGLFATGVAAKYATNPFIKITAQISDVQYLIRSKIWREQIKKILLEELSSMQFDP